MEEAALDALMSSRGDLAHLRVRPGANRSDFAALDAIELFDLGQGHGAGGFDLEDDLVLLSRLGEHAQGGVGHGQLEVIAHVLGIEGQGPLVLADGVVDEALLILDLPEEEVDLCGLGRLRGRSVAMSRARSKFRARKAVFAFLNCSTNSG